MIPVIVESPYGGNLLVRIRNVIYTRACLRKRLTEYNESPYASHLLFTQPGVLEDGNPHERRLGIKAGFVWRSSAYATRVFCDYGITKGMREGVRHASMTPHVVTHEFLFDSQRPRFVQFLKLILFSLRSLAVRLR